MRMLSQRAMVICLGLLLAGGIARAQGHGPGGGGPGGGSPGGGPGGGGPGGGGQGGSGQGGGMGGPGGPGFGRPGGDAGINPNTRGNGGPGGGPRQGSGSGGGPGGGGPASPSVQARGGGLQLGPPGRWWDDKSFSRTLGLSKEQQKRMDGVFNANKSAIVENYNSLQKAESRLQELSQEKKLDEAKIFSAIDAVAEARTTLQKANAHMLLLIRQEMDADQIGRLEKTQ